MKYRNITINDTSKELEACADSVLLKPDTQSATKWGALIIQELRRQVGADWTTSMNDLYFATQDQQYAVYNAIEYLMQALREDDQLNKKAHLALVSLREGFTAIYDNVVESDYCKQNDI